MNTITKWAVTVVDISNNSPHKAKILAFCVDEATAENYIKIAIEEYVNQNDQIEMIVNFKNKEVRSVEYDYGMSWNIEKVEIDC